jgi:hypothetical protein
METGAWRFPKYSGLNVPSWCQPSSSLISLLLAANKSVPAAVAGEFLEQEGHSEATGCPAHHRAAFAAVVLGVFRSREGTLALPM